VVRHDVADAHLQVGFQHAPVGQDAGAAPRNAALHQVCRVQVTMTLHRYPRQDRLAVLGRYFFLSHRAVGPGGHDDLDVPIGHAAGVQLIQDQRHDLPRGRETSVVVCDDHDPLARPGQRAQLRRPDGVPQGPAQGADEIGSRRHVAGRDVEEQVPLRQLDLEGVPHVGDAQAHGFLLVWR
jgi:hypothetical protein